MAGNAVEKLIYDELKGVDELLNIHAYHKQVLTDLLKKMNGWTGKIGRHINTLDITQRSANCLMAEGIYTLDDLTRTTAVELLKTPNLGHKSLRNIQDALAKEGLSLNMYPEKSYQSIKEKVLCAPDVDWIKPVEVINNRRNLTEEERKEIPDVTKSQQEFSIVPMNRPRKRGPSIPKQRVIEVARMVASRIRKHGGMKYKHLRDMAKTGEISDYERSRMNNRIRPNVIGLELYRSIFKGTKYANKK